MGKQTVEAPLLVQEPQQTALARPDDVLGMIERLASNPQFDVDKLKALLDMKERIDGRAAEAEFNAAMTEAQKALRPIVVDSENKQTNSSYASYEALDSVARPVYTGHGFSLSFDTADGAPPEHVRVLCYVAHCGGHTRTYRVDLPADGKGAKGGDVMTKTHAAGSALSYAQRYLLRLVFNIAVSHDDDGNAAGTPKPPMPNGFADWWTDLEIVAEDGLDALVKAWKASPAANREYVFRANRREWEQLKVKATKAKAGGK